MSFDQPLGLMAVVFQVCEYKHTWCTTGAPSAAATAAAAAAAAPAAAGVVN